MGWIAYSSIDPSRPWAPWRPCLISAVIPKPAQHLHQCLWDEQAGAVCNPDVVAPSVVSLVSLGGGGAPKYFQYYFFLEIKEMTTCEFSWLVCTFSLSRNSFHVWTAPNTFPILCPLCPQPVPPSEKHLPTVTPWPITPTENQRTFLMKKTL